jgi:uncharacterized protein (TIGR02246 family)
MRQALTIALTLALGAGVSGCRADRHHDHEGAAADTEALAGAVKAEEQKMLDGFRARNADAVAALYASDATVMLPFEAPMSGSDAIKAGIAETLADPAFKLDFSNQKTDVAGSGDLAYTRGAFTVTYTNSQTKKPETLKGGYVTVFRKQADGSWKVVEDVSSPGAPDAAG